MEENLRQQPSNLIKITVFGPESTGKTTLCKQLSIHFNEPWIEEFARDYLQNKLEATNQTCTESDLIPIAIGQMELENPGSLYAKELLFCDTNLLLTKVFSELTYGFCNATLDKVAKEHQYDLFFLTDIDMPWKSDGLRDKPNSRQQDFDYFENTLKQNKKPYIKLSGTAEERLKTAINAITKLQKAKGIGLSSNDFIQIYDRKIDVSNIEQQLLFFKNGIQKMNLVKAAKINDGIFAPNQDESQNFVSLFDNNKNNYDLQKFVPASGAASRMFKFLSEFINDFLPDSETINAYINRKKATELSIFFAGLEKFPFYKNVVYILKQNPNFNNCNQDVRKYHFIKTMLENFNFANKPKGIIPFHLHNNQMVTPVEEHLSEAMLYAISNNVAKLHFTIAAEHKYEFDDVITGKKLVNVDFQSIQTDYSYQKQSTDTLAVDMQNQPLRDENQQLVFRPGGHGALIENLNSLQADIIFIKNIDNVSNRNLSETVYFKKLLAGILINLQKQIFQYLNYFENYDFEDIEKFAQEKCNIILDNNYFSQNQTYKFEFLKSKLNRPIRVCGMVKNEGEPGGGPFWVLDESGNISLQIVESVQIDIENQSQSEILKSATHFNPVDLVCGIKNHKNQKFNLPDFVDINAGFIVEKNKNGIDLKAFELPGLWNGAMAKWTTIFVEVPLSTFSPVKTVNDLLKPAHQNHE